MGVSSPSSRNQFAAAPADRRVRIVVNLAAGDVGHLRIEQRGQGAQDAALGLAAQSQQNEIVARKNRIDDLRHDRVVISDDAGENGAALHGVSRSGCRASRPSRAGCAAVVR